MPDPKMKRVRKRNMRDPLSASEFDSFKKEQKENFSSMKKAAAPPPKRKKTKEEIRKEILKSDYEKRKKEARKAIKKGRLMSSAKGPLVKKNKKTKK